MNRLKASVQELRPRITVIGIGGAGCNAINNMIDASLQGVNFVVANTDAQALATSHAEHKVQLGAKLTEGLGAGSRPEIGEAAAEEAIDDIRRVVEHSHMVFIAAGMGGGTGTGAASVIARTAREMGILTVAVVTKPFQFEGSRRQRIAEAGIAELRPHVDTLIVIPNQNLFRIASDKTTFAEAFVMADQVLYSGVACIVDLIVKEGLINLDFADVRTVMSGMGTAMMGTGEASGEGRAILAAEEAISNPLLDDVTLQGAKGLLLSITGGNNLTLYEVDEAASRVRQEVDPDANIIVGATFDDSLGDRVRVSIVASGMARLSADQPRPTASAAPHSMSKAMSQPQSPTPAQPVAPAMAIERATAQPALSTAQPQHASASPPPNAEAASNGDYEASFADALRGYSQHDYAPNSEPPPLPAGTPSWHGSDDVDIEEHRPGAFAHGGYAAPAGQFGSTPRQSAYDEFQPQPPAEVRRPVRRMPEVEDFPPVGQRDYYAKAPPRAAPPPMQPEPRKRGFFERLMGSGKSREDGTAERHEPHAGPSHGTRAPAHEAPRSDPHHNPHNETTTRQENQELPVFFTRSRR